MARTITEIKNTITTAFMANETIAGYYGFAVGASFTETFSLVSFENMLFDVIAYAHYFHEQIFSQHTTEINEKIRTQKIGRLPWYREMALLFQYGYNLVPDYDYYDNTGLTVEQIETSKIIKYAAVAEAEQSNTVIIKISGENAPVTDEQREAFEDYVNEWKIAGTDIRIINYLPDRLYLNIQVKRDAEILTAEGMSVANGNYPVQDAINEYLTELPFNGELKLSALIDKLQVINGVIDATVFSAQTSWIDPAIDDYGTPVEVTVSTIPESGYFEVVTFDDIEYVV
ncbi:hypothetical protein GCM10007424_23880 [Flavobacterium suaedae]|uniref:Nucleotidyltransferase n=1 Tax=Flavobacterium suaedae TaxID=1767027 RepID=A0ABQ1K0B6_9FLAO|nr:nucleotidyltransferase [Flavobacterium suaedae]GGB83082.1 hypothetical protein GCM10007424_23880 [Flavobacterium suaedae]